MYIGVIYFFMAGRLHGIAYRTETEYLDTIRMLNRSGLKFEVVTHVIEDQQAY